MMHNNLNDTDDSHKWNFEQKEPDTQKGASHVIPLIEGQKKKKKRTGKINLKVRIAVILGGKLLEKAQRCLW